MIALINQMIGSSHSQLCNKNSCSVKMQGGPVDHNPRKIPVEKRWIIISQNNSECLLLNDKQMPHEIQNTKKMKTRESKEGKFDKKTKRKG